MADNYIDVTLSEIFGTGVASVEQTETSAEPGGYNVWTITLTNGQTSTFTVRNGTAGGSPMPVLNSVDMVDTTGIYLYLGNEEGFVTGHWYCYANDAWTDYGAYSEKGDPGLAPTVEISKTGGTTTITITDAEGEHVATIEDGISPTVNVANTAAEMTDTSLIYVYAGSETNYVVGDWYFYDSYIGQWRSGGQYQSTVPSIDSTLTITGAAADAKKTGDEINDLKSQISDLQEEIEGGGSGLTTEIKQALLQFARKVAYVDDDGQTYYDDLYDALYPPIVYTAITLDKSSMSFNALNATQQLTATTTPRGGDVTWSSSDTSIATVSSTGLVTSVDYGNVTITATCGGLTATCSVVVAQATVTSISASYSQGSKVVYDTASLDDLKADLVVTAHYSDNTSGAVTGYTLSGTLTEGTSTITVEYGGQTTTFNVTVTKYVTPPTFYFAPSNSDKLVENVMINDQGMPVSNTGSYYVDEFIECLATAPLNSSLAFEVPNRTAFYDSSKEFLSRVWVQRGIAHNDDATYCKLGWANSGSTSASYLLAVGACNDIFTNTGYRVNSSGALETSVDEDSASDYIEIDSSATKFILYATNTTTKYAYRLVFYDSNKEFISYFNTVANGTPYLDSIPANAKYFRASAPVDHITCGFPIMVEL